MTKAMADEIICYSTLMQISLIAAAKALGHEDMSNDDLDTLLVAFFRSTKRE